MLTQKQKRSVIRALTKAYYLYRDLNLLQVCRKSKTLLYIDRGDDFSGSERDISGESGRYRQAITIPGKKCPRLYKEHVFWHEFCHIFLERLGLYPRYVGYQGHLQQFDHDGGYWIYERLCEAFADAMLLYRYGVAEKLLPSLGAFLFEDTASIGYAEAVRFSKERIDCYCKEAREAKRNLDLSDFEQLQQHQERYAYYAAHQQMLPTAFYEHHQCPGPRFVDEEKDLEHRYAISKGKKSWEDIFPFQQKMLTLMHSFQDDEENQQLALFPERAALDRKKFERIYKQLEKLAGPLLKNPA